MQELKRWRRSFGIVWEGLVHPTDTVARVRNKIEEIETRKTGSESRRTLRHANTEGWERTLHEALGHPWPCGETGEFSRLWADEMESLWTNENPPLSCYDPGRGITQAVWCLTRHIVPTSVIETGLGRGVTTAFILEGLARNEKGHLWTIDLPPFAPGAEAHLGEAVTDAQQRRWTYVRGASRRHLPALIRSLKTIDLFLHDSAHTERNVRFELETSWDALRPGGALAVDDVLSTASFAVFLEKLTAREGVPILGPNEEGDAPAFGVVIKSRSVKIAGP